MTKHMIRTKLIASVTFCVVLCSCSHSTPAASPAAPSPVSRESNVRASREWDRQYVALANRFTERTYQCMSEMYSLSYSPVNSGPVCREACALLKQINAFVDAAPDYVPNAKQYRLEDAKFCRVRKQPRKELRHE